MRSHVLAWLVLPLVLQVTVPRVAGAGCATPSEIAALDASLRGQLQCVRVRFDHGAAAPCQAPGAPACAGSGVAEVVDLVSGLGPPPVGAQVKKQLRCQRAILGATRRYAGKRVREFARGARAARLASAFAAVRDACDGIAVADLQTSRLPTLGPPCATATATLGPLDGVRVARCARASLERLIGEMTTGVLRPNVVLVMTDDQNVASLPWMERVSELRRRGVDFTNAFASTPVCGPSRASLLSALYAHHHGVLGNYLAAPSFDSSSTLATWLSDAGYTTALIGKYMNYAADLDAVPPGWHEWQAALLDEYPGSNGYTHYAIDENGVTVPYGPAPRDFC